MATCKDSESGSDHITQICIYCSNVSDGYCNDCEMFMCQTCFEKHTRARPCRHHVLVDNSNNQDIKNKCYKPCVHHPLQIIQFYCVDHGFVGCSQCFFPGHRYCRFEEIQKAAEEFQQRGDDLRLKDKLHELESKHSEYRNRCDEDKGTVEDMNAKVVKNVKLFKKDVIEFAKKVESHALEEAERLRIDNEMQIEKRMSELDSVGENIEQCLVKLEKQNTADEFFLAAVEVKPEVEKLEQKLTSIEGLGAVRRYTFAPRSDVMEMIQDVHSCGAIQTVPEIEQFESRCIIVSKVPDTVTKETLQFYFENHRRSGGGEVNKVELNDDGTWLVCFTDYTVIDNVLQKKHILSGQKIIVQRYQEYLGRPEGDVMGEMERERQQVTEVINNLKKIDTKMLLADKFPEQMEKKFKIQMKININKNELVFEGPTISAVREAMLEMHERKGSFAYKKLDNLPKLCVQLYDLKQCREYIVKEKLKAARVTAVWDKESDTAIKVCSNYDDIEDSFGIVQASVRSQIIALKKEHRSLINSEKWRAKVFEVQMLSPGKCLIETDYTKVVVYATDDVVDDIAYAVKKFLRLNT